jgi:hypothetical protein
VVGTLVWDRVVRDDRPAPVEEWGGIAYALEALSAALPEEWEIVPLVKVGQDLSERALRFLRTVPRVSVGPGVSQISPPSVSGGAITTDPAPAVARWVSTPRSRRAAWSRAAPAAEASESAGATAQSAPIPRAAAPPAARSSVRATDSSPPRTRSSSDSAARARSTARPTAQAIGFPP